MAAHCGAKTRSGGRCRKPAMPNGRCRLHGGKSTGPKNQEGNKNAQKHGIYSQHLTVEELDCAKAIKLGNVEHELRLVRIRLRRALAAEAAAAGEPELDEIIERDIDKDIGARHEEKSRVRDYCGLIDKLLARIESLERTRKELNKDDGAGDTPDDRPISRIVVEVVGAKPSHDHDRATG